MVEKVCCAIKGNVGESRRIAGKVVPSSASRPSQRRACGDATLEKRVADAMNARNAARAPIVQQTVGGGAFAHGVHPALMLELTAIWQQVDAAYTFGGEWQRLFALGDVADRLAVILNDPHTPPNESGKRGETDRPSSDVGAPGPSDGFDVLCELLELKDLREAINGSKARGDDERETMVTDYEKRMSLAWARARRVVAAGLSSGKQL